LLTQIKLRHEALVAIQDEIGSTYPDRAARNEVLFKSVTEAIDGQVKQINIEKDAVIQECRDFITRTINMRKAMGERLSIEGAAADRIDIQKVFPLLMITDVSHIFKLSNDLNRKIVLSKPLITNVLSRSKVSDLLV
jgi:hypothetical protein